MKFDCKLPGGGEIHFEREPMSWDRFQMICILIGIFIVGSGLLKLAEIAARR